MDGAAGLFAEIQHRVLIHKVVAAFDGIKGVQVVRIALAEINDAVDAALGHGCSATGGHGFGDHANPGLGVGLHGGNRSAQASAAGANDNDVKIQHRFVVGGPKGGTKPTQAEGEGQGACRDHRGLDEGASVHEQFFV